MYLEKKELKSLILEKKEIIIRPLLNESQIGELTVDFRLGTDFLLSFQGRHSAIDVSNYENPEPSSSFFQETRRLVGSTFLFHPMQTVLCSTLEYIKLPPDIFLSLSVRSSYSRLGFSISSIVQPGYCGCLSIELTNVNNTPVKVTVGSRIIQARFFRIKETADYFSSKRKYICQVRPEVSIAHNDEESAILKKIREAML
jgi:dCTP deaminase